MEKVGLDKIATGVSILVAVAVVFLEFESASRHIVAWVISGLFTLLALALSLLDIHEHFQNYVQPSLQRYAVRIIFMVRELVCCADRLSGVSFLLAYALRFQCTASSHGLHFDSRRMHSF